MSVVFPAPSTEVIENSDPTYFNRIPRIYLLDGAKTALVVLGDRLALLCISSIS